MIALVANSLLYNDFVFVAIVVSERVAVASSNNNIINNIKENYQNAFKNKKVAPRSYAGWQYLMCSRSLTSDAVSLKLVAEVMLWQQLYF